MNGHARFYAFGLFNSTLNWVWLSSEIGRCMVSLLSLTADNDDVAAGQLGLAVISQFSLNVRREAALG